MASILLCDDEAQVARALKRMLRDHQVVLADGPDGLDHLKRQRFDVILTDLLMPGVDGFAILEAARRYVEAFERITGRPFVADLRAPLPRIRAALQSITRNP